MGTGCGALKNRSGGRHPTEWNLNGREDDSLFSAGLAVCEGLEALARLVSLFPFIGERFQSSLLPFNRFLEIADLRVGRRKRGQEVAGFPGSQFAGLGRVRHGLLAIANSFL